MSIDHIDMIMIQTSQVFKNNDWSSVESIDLYRAWNSIKQHHSVKMVCKNGHYFDVHPAYFHESMRKSTCTGSFKNCLRIVLLWSKSSKFTIMVHKSSMIGANWFHLVCIWFYCIFGAFESTGPGHNWCFTICIWIKAPVLTKLYRIVYVSFWFDQNHQNWP